MSPSGGGAFWEVETRLVLTAVLVWAVASWAASASTELWDGFFRRITWRIVVAEAVLLVAWRREGRTHASQYDSKVKAVKKIGRRNLISILLIFASVFSR